MQIFFLFLKINLLYCYRNRFFTKNSSVFSKKKNGFMRKPRIYGPTAQTCLMWVFMNGAVSRDFIPSSNNGDCLPGTLFEARLFQKKQGTVFHLIEPSSLKIQNLSALFFLAAEFSGSAVVANEALTTVIEAQHRKFSAFEVEAFAVYKSARLSLSKLFYFSAKCVVKTMSLYTSFAHFLTDVPQTPTGKGFRYEGALNLPCAPPIPESVSH